MNSHLRLPRGNPTCDSYERTNELTEKGWLSSRDLLTLSDARAHIRQIEISHAVP